MAPIPIYVGQQCGQAPQEGKKRKAPALESTAQQPQQSCISVSRGSQVGFVAAHLSNMPFASLGIRLYEQNNSSGAGRRSFHQKPLNSTRSLWYLQGSGGTVIRLELSDSSHLHGAAASGKWQEDGQN